MMGREREGQKGRAGREERRRQVSTDRRAGGRPVQTALILDLFERSIQKNNNLGEREKRSSKQSEFDERERERITDDHHRVGPQDTNRTRGGG